MDFLDSVDIVDGRPEQGEKGACPVAIGLLTALTAVLYGGTVSVLALTATFARRHGLRREARSTLAVLLHQGSPRSQGGPPAALEESHAGNTRNSVN